MIKFCTHNPTSNFNNYLWNGVLRSSCKVVTTLLDCEHLAQSATTLWQPCYNLAKLCQGCYNLEISIWVCSYIGEVTWVMRGMSAHWIVLPSTRNLPLLLFTVSIYSYRLYIATLPQLCKVVTKLSIKLWHFVQGIHNLTGLWQPCMMTVKLHSSSNW